ncbi:MAG: YceI family protein [Pseudorhodobacter sp.]|nr:YceI family protein [Pseudorhodobacter sp.]
MLFNRTTLLAALASLVLAGAALAAPVSYVLDTTASVVGFETDFGPDRITGQMPVTRADLSLDFSHVARSTVAVTLDASAAVASFPFAAQAMRGPKVLNVAEHPQIAFQSTSVKAEGNGARVDGQVTIRGATRPMVLHATIWRQQGSVATDLSHLVIRLTGAVNRSAFGATGWADMVGDEVRLDIVARIVQVP